MSWAIDDLRHDILSLFVEAMQFGRREKLFDGFGMYKRSSRSRQSKDPSERIEYMRAWNRRPEVRMRSRARAAIQRSRLTPEQRERIREQRRTARLQRIAGQVP